MDLAGHATIPPPLVQLRGVEDDDEPPRPGWHGCALDRYNHPRPIGSAFSPQSHRMPLHLTCGICSATAPRSSQRLDDGSGENASQRRAAWMSAVVGTGTRQDAASQHRCFKCIANLARPAPSPANHARCAANDAALPARIELPHAKSGQPLAFFAHRRSSTIIGAWISTDHLATSLPPTYPRNNFHHRQKEQL